MAAYDCLLPTGFMVQVKAPGKNPTFADLKAEVWKQWVKLPVPPPQKPDSFGCKGVNADAELIEFDDDTPIASARLFRPVIKASSHDHSIVSDEYLLA